ncbi:MAG: M1 family peptidase [Sphingobacteriales bacterium]|nr:MAG: M1 family peptidase [Sphingobacteriales bacterium]
MHFRKRLFLLLLVPVVAHSQITKPYFQQRVDTKLQVSLNDVTHVLTATTDYTYTNNSPDTLHSVFFNLHPNAYQSDQAAFNYQQVENGKTAFYYSKDNDKGGFRTLSFGEAGLLRYRDNDSVHNIDQGELLLQTPILPGETRLLHADFTVKIPAVFSRFGHTGQAYFITQWFPKPAVYDREGWHPMPYLDQGEFFDEIGSYDVTITVPENYVVMATGNLQTERESQWLDSLSRIPLNNVRNPRDTFPRSASMTKTLRFTEANIHDFAWFADKRFIVRKDSLQVAGNDFYTTTWTAFLPSDTGYWKRGNQYLKAALKTYSANLGPYPYRTIKGVEGDMKAGGGMEYPTITVIDKDASSSLKTVLIHEAGHNWFQGILASNERRYPWLDEGMNSFYEWKAVQEYDQMRRDSAIQKNIRVSKNDLRKSSAETMLYYELARTGDDQALNLSSEDYRNANYGGDVYYKTAAWMRWLEAYMGEEPFRKATQAYYAEWKFKHPQPEDLFAQLRTHSPKNIDWFLNHVFSTTEPVDFSLRTAGRTNDSIRVQIKNRLSFAAPAVVLGLKNDSVIAQAQTAPFSDQTTVSLPRLDYDQILLSPAVPDVKNSNNSTARGIKLGFAGGFRNAYKAQTWLSPAIGYNTYDGVQLGLLLQNIFAVPQSPFRYALAPTYAFRSKSLTGAASAGYFWFPKRGLFQSVGLQADFKSYHYTESGFNVPELIQARYTKLTPELSFIFRNGNPRSPVTNSLSLRAYGIREEGFNYIQSPADSLYRPTIASTDLYYGRVRYEHRNERAVNPFSYGAEVHGNGDFVKLILEGNLRINYHKQGQWLDLRGFAGKLIVPSGTLLPRRYALQASSTGINDYLYDGTYLGRSEQDGISGRQFAMREGGLKIPTPLYANPLGVSDDWLVAANLSTTLPVLPIRLFFDVATFKDAGQLNPSGSKFLYDGGVSLHLPYDILSVYWPFIMSNDYKDYLQSVHGKSGLSQTLVFQLKLQNINWLRFTSKAIKEAM